LRMGREPEYQSRDDDDANHRSDKCSLAGQHQTEAMVPSVPYL
jgi:hypothetical protein